MSTHDFDKDKTRTWCMRLYPEDPTHQNAFGLLTNSGYQFAGILHDKDIWKTTDPEFDPTKHTDGQLKKPHWHIVLNVGNNPRYRIPIANELGIPKFCLEPARNKDAALTYLVHDGFPDKHQYDIDEVFGSLAPAVAKLLADDSEECKVLRVLDVLDSMPLPVSYRALLTRCCQLGLYAELRRMGSGAMRLLDEHNNEFLRAQYERDDLKRSRTRNKQRVDNLEPFERCYLGSKYRDDDNIPTL